jgi:sporulation protein YlmC with PRC-barrel domain
MVLTPMILALEVCMNKFVRIMPGLLFIAVMALPKAQSHTLAAEGATATGGSGEALRHQQSYRASKIIGSTVRDAQGRRIGQIKELVLDSRRGEIAYVIVSFGGVMGVGKKLHAIPWRAFQLGDTENHYVLAADRETINLAPGFDKAKWPDMADQKWSTEVERYWARTVGRGPGGHNDLSSGAVGTVAPAGQAKPSR